MTHQEFYEKYWKLPEDREPTPEEQRFHDIMTMVVEQVNEELKQPPRPFVVYRSLEEYARENEITKLADFLKQTTKQLK